MEFIIVSFTNRSVYQPIVFNLIIIRVHQGRTADQAVSSEIETTHNRRHPTSRFDARLASNIRFRPPGRPSPDSLPNAPSRMGVKVTHEIEDDAKHTSISSTSIYD